MLDLSDKEIQPKYKYSNNNLKNYVVYYNHSNKYRLLFISKNDILYSSQQKGEVVT